MKSGDIKRIIIPVELRYGLEGVATDWDLAAALNYGYVVLTVTDVKVSNGSVLREALLFILYKAPESAE